MSFEHPFELLRSVGLAGGHRVLDIGCGSLGLAKLLIPYLEKRRYFGVEPQQALIEDGVRFVLGHDLFDRKEPQFLTCVDFAFHRFGVKFDYMMAHGLFPEIGEAMVLACLRVAAASLQRDGVLLASWVVGPRDYEGAGWNPTVRAEYTGRKMESLAREAGLAFEVLDWAHPDGQFWGAFSLRAGTVESRDRDVSLGTIGEGHLGYVERVQEVGGYQLVEGWAFDPVTRRPATEVVIVDGAGAISAVMPVSLERSDAAAVHGGEALRSGFRGLVRNERLGDIAGLRFYAVCASGKAYQIKK